MIDIDIIVCTEGNPRMGMGHIYRTLTLAEELGGKVTFLTKSGEDVVKKIESHGHPVIQVIDDDAIANILRASQRKIVIFDRLEVDPYLAKRIKEYGHFIVIFGSLSDANMHADIVINVIGSCFENREWIDESHGALFFQGPRYYIFKKKFFELVEMSVEPEPGRYLICFGGSDNLNLTERSLEILSGKAGIQIIDIIVGSGYKNLDSLTQQVKTLSNMSEINLFVDIEDVASIMVKSATVITSPGMSMFEAFFLKRQVLAFAQNEFHQQVFSNYFRINAPESIVDLYGLIKGDGTMDPTSSYISRMEIGHGKGDILCAIAKLGGRK